MAAVSVGLHFNERRPAAAARTLDCSDRVRVDGLDVLSIDDEGRDLVGFRSLGEVVDRRRVAQWRVLGVEVVRDDQHERRVPDRRHVERFVERPDVGGAVAKEGERDARFGSHLEGHRRAECDRYARTDDGVRTDVALAEVDEVHRPADAFRAPGRSTRYLARLGGGGMGDTLKIERVETIPLRVPLPFTYSGSHYRMRNRCTIVTRVYTSAGIVGEAYNADEDSPMQEQILQILHEEVAPRVIGLDALQTERCWEAMLPPTFDHLRPTTPRGSCAPSGTQAKTSCSSLMRIRGTP